MLSSVRLPILLAAATIHGAVRNETTREPIAHAVVEVPGLGRRVAADERGYFVIVGVPAGTWRVRAEALGYRSLEREVEVGSDGAVVIDFALPVAPFQLDRVEVVAVIEPAASAMTAGPPPVRVEGAGNARSAITSSRAVTTAPGARPR